MSKQYYSLWVPAFFAILTTGLALILILFTESRYEATMLIGPVADRSSSQQGSLRALAGQIGGLNLSSLGGFGTPHDSQLDLLLEVIKTPDLGEVLEKKYGILVKLFPKKWDFEKKEWKRPVGLVAGVKDFIAWVQKRAILETPVCAGLCKSD